MCTFIMMILSMRVRRYDYEKTMRGAVAGELLRLGYCFLFSFSDGMYKRFVIYGRRLGG